VSSSVNAGSIEGLVDSNLDEEAAVLTALQGQKHLAYHALSIANARAQSYLSLLD
jgi:flagellin-like hook-associated protein FlgL